MKIFPLLLWALLLNSCVLLKPGLVGQDQFRADAVELAVSGRQGRVVGFGPFFTNEFDPGKIRTTCDPTPPFVPGHAREISSTTQQRIAFRQNDSLGRHLIVWCTARKETRTVRYSTTSSQHTHYREHYRIEVYGEDGEGVLEVGPDSCATITVADISFTVCRHYRHDRSAALIFDGVIISEKDSVVAAVSLIDRGIVWLRNGLDHRRSLIAAALSTALLIRPTLAPTP